MILWQDKIVYYVILSGSKIKARQMILLQDKMTYYDIFCHFVLQQNHLPHSIPINYSKNDDLNADLIIGQRSRVRRWTNIGSEPRLKTIQVGAII